jgi:hypothetical protein
MLFLHYKDQPFNAVEGKISQYCENHTNRYIATLCGQYVEFLNVTEDGIYVQDVRWLKVVTSGLDSWRDTESKFLTNTPDSEPAQSYGILKCKWIIRGGHEITRKLVENDAVLQFVYNKCSKWPPSSWIRSLARFRARTEVVGWLIILVAHLTVCVWRGMSSKTAVSWCIHPPCILLKVTCLRRVP